MDLNLEKPRKSSKGATPKAESRVSDLTTSIDFTNLDKITEESLGFSAITDGLGFHPKERPLGTLRPSNEMDSMDFIAAREPVSATPQADDTAKLRANLTAAAADRADSISGSTAVIAPTPLLKEVLALDSATEVRHTPLIRQAPDAAARPATPRERLTAFALDLAIIAVPIWFTLLWNFSDEPAFFTEHGGSATAFVGVVFLAYLLIAESLGGQTLGKMALDLVVVEDDKYRKPVGFEKSLLRLAFFLLGSLPFGLGSIASLWDSSSRAWHDRVSGSVVERMAQD